MGCLESYFAVFYSETANENFKNYSWFVQEKVFHFQLKFCLYFSAKQFIKFSFRERTKTQNKVNNNNNNNNKKQEKVKTSDH